MSETTQTTPSIESKIEQRLAKYFQNKAIAKERNEENQLIFEELEELFNKLGTEDFTYQLSSGEFAVLKKKPRIQEKLDKDSLANSLQMSKDELKTPFDFSMLTQQGKLTPKMISEHTETEVKVKLSASKVKRKPKKKKEER